MKLEEWKTYIEKHGTSGDMVDNILSDWEQDHKKLLEYLEWDAIESDGE